MQVRRVCSMWVGLLVGLTLVLTACVPLEPTLSDRDEQETAVAAVTQFHATAMARPTWTPRPTPTVPVLFPTPTPPPPLPKPEEVLEEYRQQVAPLVEKLQAAQEPPAGLQLPEAAHCSIALVPLSERLFYIQRVLFPEPQLGRPGASCNLYVAYGYRRGEPLGAAPGPGIAVAASTQEVIAELRLVAEVEGQLYLAQAKEGVGGVGSSSIQGMVTWAVEPLDPLGDAAAEVEGDLEAIIGYAAGLDWREWLPLDQRLALLTWALSNENWSDRREAAYQLGRIGAKAKDAVPALIATLGDSDSGVRETAALALGEIGPEAKAAVPALIQALGDEDEGVREGAAIVLGDIGPEEGVVPVLLQALGDGDSSVREAAVGALGKIALEAQEVLPALLKALQDESLMVRARAAEVLGRVETRSEEVVPALARALEDSSEWVREAAAASLGRIGPAAKAAVPALIQALQDWAPQVRHAAAEALGRIGPEAKAAVPALVQALQDETAGVRRAAARALGEIKPALEEVVPALIQALEDADSSVREAAFKALEALTGLNFGPDGARWKEWWKNRP